MSYVPLSLMATGVSASEARETVARMGDGRAARAGRAIAWATAETIRGKVSTL